MYSNYDISASTSHARFLGSNINRILTILNLMRYERRRRTGFTEFGPRANEYQPRPCTSLLRNKSYPPERILPHRYARGVERIVCFIDPRGSQFVRFFTIPSPDSSTVVVTFAEVHFYIETYLLSLVRCTYAGPHMCLTYIKLHRSLIRICA